LTHIGEVTSRKIFVSLSDQKLIDWDTKNRLMILIDTIITKKKQSMKKIEESKEEQVEVEEEDIRIKDEKSINIV